MVGILAIYTLLIIYFSFLNQLVELERRKICKVNTGDMVHMVMYYKTQITVSSHKFLAFVKSFLPDWQRFRQGPLMVKFRLKKYLLIMFLLKMFGNPN